MPSDYHIGTNPANFRDAFSPYPVFSLALDLGTRNQRLRQLFPLPGPLMTLLQYKFHYISEGKTTGPPDVLEGVWATLLSSLF